jgi:hypothetical protein
VQDDAVAQGLPVLVGDVGRLAELGHVGQKRHLDRLSHRLELLSRGQSLGEDDVCAGCFVSLGALDGGFEALYRRGVCAGDHDEGRVALGLDGGTHLLGHAGAGDEALALKVAAALVSRVLVLDLHGGGAGCFE